MKKIISHLIFSFSLLSSVAEAANFSGSWSGTGTLSGAVGPSMKCPEIDAWVKHEEKRIIFSWSAKCHDSSGELAYETGWEWYKLDVGYSGDLFDDMGIVGKVLDSSFWVAPYFGEFVSKVTMTVSENASLVFLNEFGTHGSGYTSQLQGELFLNP